MAELIQSIRGMNDLLPDNMVSFVYLERLLADVMENYGYREIRTPYLESTLLFKRSIGEVTDVVEKEMYTFTDLNGDSISLRPEGTASCVRACLEHGLLHNQQQKLWYLGPMFRHEKPQKGRYRQFYQCGVEVLGIHGVTVELELIALCRRIWEKLGILNVVTLEVNTIGTAAERQAYKTALVTYLQSHIDKLDMDSKRRLETNPLRILDSKHPETQQVLIQAPVLHDFLTEDSRKHFSSFCAGLEALGIHYKINNRLVRGLDYYGHTVFEWTTDKLGAQATICAGGRYDGLVEQLGGQATPAVGFAMGIERLLLLCQAQNVQFSVKQRPRLFLLSATESGLLPLLAIAETIRAAGLKCDILTQTQHSSLKSQFKKADKSGALFALVLGEDELKSEEITLKHLREDIPQERIAVRELVPYLRNKLENL